LSNGRLKIYDRNHRINFYKRYNKSKIILKGEEKMLREKIEAVLGKVKPLLQRDGGDVELVDVLPDGTVKVRLTGACSGCPMSTMTLKNAIEETIKKEVPEVKSVVQV
jgi:Fe-S cluster biogenesis protein NfuA